MIHTMLLPSFLTSHFSKGWGSLGRSATQKSLVMKRCGYQPQKGQSGGLNPLRHRKDKIANIPQQNFPNTFRILLTKHNLNLVPNLTPPPKLNMDLAVISSSDSDLGSQVESPICKAHEGIYIFLIPQKLI